MGSNGSTELATIGHGELAQTTRRYDPGTVMESVIAKGDLSKLTPAERAQYYVAVCESVGLNPLTRPFLYVDFGEKGGGLQLYAGRTAADQLRGMHKVSTRVVDQRIEKGIFVVTVEARHPDGRTETDIGAVPIENQSGLFLANAMKKAITQGKRRATLALVGLGHLDEDELRAIPNARIVREVDYETGEILSASPSHEIVDDAPPGRDWYAQIAATATLSDLKQLGVAMGAAGVRRETHRDLMLAYADRLDELRAAAEMDQIAQAVDRAIVP